MNDARDKPAPACPAAVEISESTIPTDLLTPIEAAKLLGTSSRSVRNWIRFGRLPAFRIGGRLRICRADALAMFQRVKTPGPMLPTKAESEARARWVDETLKSAGVRR